MTKVEAKTSRNDVDTDLVHELLKKYHETKSEKIREKVVKECMGLVRKIANNLARRSNDPVDDLIQVGCIGLIKGIENFDNKHDAKCTTYFTHLIAGEMRHYCRDRSMLFRAPRELVELNFRINRIIHVLTTELGREPTNGELARALEVPENKIQQAFEVDRRRSVFSLDQTFTSDGSEEGMFLDTVVDKKEEKSRDLREKNIVLQDAFAHITAESRDVLEFIYFQENTQAAYARYRKISQMQTSRRLRAALAELRRYFHSIGQKSEF